MSSSASMRLVEKKAEYNNKKMEKLNKEKKHKYYTQAIQLEII